MFTGIIEEIGTVSAIHKTKTGISLKIKTLKISSDIKLGDSIAVNGVCLSVSDIKNSILSFDVIFETLRTTNLGGLKLDDRVNLEDSLKADSRIGGHFVSGHIDYKVTIKQILNSSDGRGFRISFPAEYSNLIVKKGAICVDGVSLTIAEVSKEDFTVYLIPHTLKASTLGDRKKGDILNIETDLLAKYISKNSPKSNLQDTLKKYNYI